jgi:hypothetical protein
MAERLADLDFDGLIISLRVRVAIWFAVRPCHPPYTPLLVEAVTPPVVHGLPVIDGKQTAPIHGQYHIGLK